MLLIQANFSGTILTLQYNQSSMSILFIKLGVPTDGMDTILRNHFLIKILAQFIQQQQILISF